MRTKYVLFTILPFDKVIFFFFAFKKWFLKLNVQLKIDGRLDPQLVTHKSYGMACISYKSLRNWKIQCYKIISYYDVFCDRNSNIIWNVFRSNQMTKPLNVNLFFKPQTLPECLTLNNCSHEIIQRCIERSFEVKSRLHFVSIVAANWIPNRCTYW